MAPSVKNPTRIDYQTRRMDFPRHDALRLNLHATFGKNYAVVPSCDDDSIPFNLPLDFGVFSENECLLGNHISFHVSVNPERARHRERALKRDSLINESGPLFV